MKLFFKNFAMAIPLAVGIILTIFSVVNAMEVWRESTAGSMSLICGVVGIPLLYASIMAMMSDQVV